MDFSHYLLLCVVILACAGGFDYLVVPISEFFANGQRAGDENTELNKEQRVRGMYFANVFFRALGVASFAMAAACISVMADPNMYNYLALAYLIVYAMIEVCFSAICQTPLFSAFLSLFKGIIMGSLISILALLPLQSKISWVTALVFFCVLVLISALIPLLSGAVSKGTTAQKVTAAFMVLSYILFSAAVLVTTILPYEKGTYSTKNYAFTQPWMLLLFVVIWNFLGGISFISWRPINTVVPLKQKNT